MPPLLFAFHFTYYPHYLVHSVGSGQDRGRAVRHYFAAIHTALRPLPDPTPTGLIPADPERVITPEGVFQTVRCIRPSFSKVPEHRPSITTHPRGVHPPILQQTFVLLSCYTIGRRSFHSVSHLKSQVRASAVNVQTRQACACLPFPSPPMRPYLFLIRMIKGAWVWVALSTKTTRPQPPCRSSTRPSTRSASQPTRSGGASGSQPGRGGGCSLLPRETPCPIDTRPAHHKGGAGTYRGHPGLSPGDLATSPPPLAQPS